VHYFTSSRTSFFHATAQKLRHEFAGGIQRPVRLVGFRHDPSGRPGEKWPTATSSFGRCGSNCAKKISAASLFQIRE
jgi:hypothetical protein